MSIKFILFGLIYFLPVSVVLADRVFVKNGDWIQGRVLLEKKGLIFVEAEHGKYRIPLRLLAKIEFTGDLNYRLVFQDGSQKIIRPLWQDQKRLKVREVIGEREVLKVYPYSFIKSMYRNESKKSPRPGQ